MYKYFQPPLRFFKYPCFYIRAYLNMTYIESYDFRKVLPVFQELPEFHSKSCQILRKEKLGLNCLLLLFFILLLSRFIFLITIITGSSTSLCFRASRLSTAVLASPAILAFFSFGRFFNHK